LSPGRDGATASGGRPSLPRRGRPEAPTRPGLAAAVRETLSALLPKLAERSDTTFLDHALAHYHKARSGLDELAQPAGAGKPVHPQHLMRLGSEPAAGGGGARGPPTSGGP